MGMPTLEPMAASTPVGVRSEETQKSLAEILSSYDLVEVVENNGDPFVIVAERGASGGRYVHADASFSIADPEVYSNLYHGRPGSGLSPVPLPRALAERDAGTVRLASGTNVQYRSYGTQDVSLFEIGTASPSPFTSFVRREYNNDLVGINGLRNYDKMRRSDGVVRGTLRGVKTPVLSARWFCKANDRTKIADKNAADYVWDNLTNRMTISWTQFITESLLMCDFGYYMFEIVWEDTIVDGKERLVVRKLAPRHPMDVIAWVYDEHGGPAGVRMYPSSGNIVADEIFIEIDKLLVFSFDREAGNIEGMSVLRSAYKHWYYKEQLYKIDAIQKERHGIGVPIIKLPAGFNDSDKALANELGRNLRTNERAHVALPYLWEFMFAELKGQPVDALASIKVHDNAIRENVLMNFMDQSTSTNIEDQMLFLKATRFIADIICESINSYLIPKMIDANFSRVGYPKLKARRIGEQADWRTLSFAIRNLIGSGALVPDDPLEEMLRDEMDLPEIDMKTRRMIETPFNQNDVPADPYETQQQAKANGGDINIPQIPAGMTPSMPQNKQSGQAVGKARQANLPRGHQQRSTAGRDNSGG